MVDEGLILLVLGLLLLLHDLCEPLLLLLLFGLLKLLEISLLVVDFLEVRNIILVNDVFVDFFNLNELLAWPQLLLELSDVLVLDFLGLGPLLLELLVIHLGTFLSSLLVDL